MGINSGFKGLNYSTYYIMNCTETSTNIKCNTDVITATFLSLFLM